MTGRVTLYSKPGCHLCDDARAVIERVCADLGESYDEVSILDDPALLERYAEEIPVTLVDGKQHDFWRVSEERLRAALAAPARDTRVTGVPDDLSVHCSSPDRQAYPGTGDAERPPLPAGRRGKDHAPAVLFSRSQTPRVAGPTAWRRPG